MDDIKLAMLGNKEAAKRLTDAGVLLKCPFCEGEAEYTETGNEHIGLKETVVRCKKCGTKQKHKWLRYKFDFLYVRNNTMLRWNTRAPILSAEEMEMLHGKENP